MDVASGMVGQEVGLHSSRPGAQDDVWIRVTVHPDLQKRDGERRDFLEIAWPQKCVM